MPPPSPPTTDPWADDPKRVPGNQPLPKLDEFLKFLRDKVVPVVAPLIAEAFYSWDKAKLDDIKSKYVPNTLAGEMGCMKACYQVLGLLYGSDTSRNLQKEVYTRAMDNARAWGKAHPDQLQAKIDAAKAANPALSDADALKSALEGVASNTNTSDHLFQLMAEKDLAGAKVNAQNATAEQTIRNMTANAPGVYFYGLAVNDNHTVTLAVDRAADGTQKMYWFDQNKPGVSHVVDPGKLGSELQDVPGHTTTTNIYPLRPPAGGAH
jgi:hypothetical protein